MLIEKLWKFHAEMHNYACHSEKYYTPTLKSENNKCGGGITEDYLLNDVLFWMRINSQSYRACIQDSLYTTVARFVTVGKVCTQLHVNLACSDELEPKPFAEIRMQIKSCRQYEIKKKKRKHNHTFKDFMRKGHVIYGKFLIILVKINKELSNWSAYVAGVHRFDSPTLKAKCHFIYWGGKKKKKSLAGMRKSQFHIQEKS